MCTPLDLITVPQPHFIPGYTGYCPQYLFRAGNTYGSCTHKVLVDPTVNHSQKLLLTDRTTDDYQVYRPIQKDVDIVKSRFRQANTVYQHPMIPGYEGFVPKLNDQFGQCYTIEATEALSEFEKNQHRNRKTRQHIKILGAIQDGNWNPKSLQERTLIKSSYKLPLTSVRPEQVGVIRDIKVIEPSLEPPIQSQSPYFMNNDNFKKHIMKGTGTYVPFGYSKFGMTNDAMTNSALCDFTTNYRKRMSTEWAPTSLSRPDPPLHFQPMEIYYKHVGLLPNYTGHIPGAKFRCGKTIGDDSKDAKRPKMVDIEVQKSFRRNQSIKSRYPSHLDYGYSHGVGEKSPRININTNEFTKILRQRQATEWQPSYLSEHLPMEIMCTPIYHNNISHIPNYGGHIPGAKFRFGRTFGKDTVDVKRWLRGDHRPN